MDDLVRKALEAVERTYHLGNVMDESPSAYKEFIEAQSEALNLVDAALKELRAKSLAREPKAVIFTPQGKD